MPQPAPMGDDHLQAFDPLDDIFGDQGSPGPQKSPSQSQPGTPGDVDHMFKEFGGQEKEADAEVAFDDVFGGVFDEGAADGDFQGDAADLLGAGDLTNRPIRLLNPPKARVKKARTEKQQLEEEVWPEEFNAKFMKVLERIRPQKPLAIRDDDALKFVQDSIQEMFEIATEDDECFGTDRPASRKMKMLPKVITIMNKYQFAVHFVTFDGCKALGAWLKNLPDGSLPNDHLRTELLQAMMRLPITKEALAACSKQKKEHSLGKVVAGLQNHPAESIENRKLAGMLVQKWVKQVLGRRSDTMDGEEETTLKPKLVRPAPETAESLLASEKESEKRQHPALPVIEGKEYLIKPVPRHQPVKRDKVDQGTNRGKIGEVLKIMQRPNKRSWKPYEVSIAGRTVNAI
mmetsp:Transcript_4871/g.13486  ORF Transcript_4871/g.13486 Transcript_4871/m.13486 type:complete len:402 (+) Transcript_4871:551-1756(+)